MGQPVWEIHNSLVSRVLETFPDAAPFVERYRQQQRGPLDQRRYGEGDGVFDFAYHLLKENGPGDSQLRSLLDFLEREYTTDEGDGVKTVISYEFLDGIYRLRDSLKDVFIKALPPTLKVKAEAFERRNTLCMDLAAADPWLAEYVNDQIEFDEEILPHVIVGDLFWKLLERMEKYGTDDHVVAKVLQILESYMENDPEEEPVLGPKNVIAVSFIYAVPYQGEYGAKLAAMLPPALAAELARQEA